MDWKVHAGRALTRIGGRFGISALTYHPGVMRLYDSFGRRDAPGFSDRLTAVFRGVGYLDVDAGTGRYAEELRRRGLQADACEHSRAGRREARRRGLLMAPFDLGAEPIIAPDISSYHVAVCLEVAEHIPPTLGDRLVSYLAGAPRSCSRPPTPAREALGISMSSRASTGRSGLRQMANDHNPSLCASFSRPKAMFRVRTCWRT
jgi:hypothetical protein